MFKKYINYLLCILFLATWSVAGEGEVKVSGRINGNQIVVVYDIPDGLHQSLEKELFTFSVQDVDGITVGDVVYPDAANKSHNTPVYHGKTELYREFKVSGTPSAEELKVTASYQVCKDSGMCYMPQDVELSIALPSGLKGAPDTAEDAKPSVSEDKTVEKAPAVSESKPVEKAPAANAVEASDKKPSSLLHMILLAFMGGMILNLMPCVLPVLSIKMMSIVSSAGQNRSEILKGGMIYTAGILVSFAVLALVIVVLKKSGESVGWGFQFQNPYFVFGLLAIIWAFALSLFGMYHIQLPGANIAHKASSSHGMAGTFMSGVFAVLLATPCTAPMLGSAVGFTLKQPAPIIFVMMLVIGLGLAFPFILLSVFPSVIKLIPKPGNWMNVFSSLMGFLLIGTAIFLARTLSFIITQDQFINVMWFMLVLSFGLWLYGLSSRPHIPRKRQWFGIVAALAVVLGCGYHMLDFSAVAADSSGFKAQNSGGVGDNWRTFSPALLTQLRQEGKPVFVDFSAEWCMTCKANEAAVLNTDDIQKDFSDRGVVLLQGDFTKKDPVILEWLRKYDRGGVPLYLLFVPGQDDAVVFPELITKSMIKKALKKHLK
jgi:thiol:disulfide interchange protein DsbD